MKNSLVFKTNNNGLLNVVQNEHDGIVHINRFEKSEGYKNLFNIPAGDFVMLLNLYQHIKENDIQNDFINPHGKNHE